jgi:phage/conjugal plasmid C-4 type zinc finger TraR family protein
VDEIELAELAISQELERRINLARRHLEASVSLPECEDCERPIPEKRRLAVPGCTRCVECQEIFEQETE